MKILIFIIGISITAQLIKVITQPAPIDKQLMSMAQEINKQCPIVVDSLIKLTHIMALPGRVLQYNYSLYKNNKEEVDTLLLKKEMKEFIINTYSTNPILKAFKDEGVSITSNFYDQSSKFICKIYVDVSEVK